jgi:hypothetical protein
MATKCSFVTRGYGQVEPNHLSAQRNGQIYAQLPMGVDMLENGQFAKYDYKEGKVNMAGAGEWMLVYNAVKVYDDVKGEYDADYAMIKPAEGTKGTPVIGVSTDVVPRLFKTNVGDIFTTNTIKAEPGALALGDTLVIDTDGYLKEGTSEDGIVWQVVKVYTMPDGQPGVKIMRIQ